jgi:hypothetical protein
MLAIIDFEYEERSTMRAGGLPERWLASSCSREEIQRSLDAVVEHDEIRRWL